MTNQLTVIFVFRLNTRKGIEIILTVVILGSSSISDTNLQVLTPEMYDKYPPYNFYIEVPLSLPLRDAF